MENRDNEAQERELEETGAAAAVAEEELITKEESGGQANPDVVKRANIAAQSELKKS